MPRIGYLDGSGQPIIGASRNVIFGDAKQVQGPYLLPEAGIVTSVSFYAANGGGGAGDVEPVVFAYSAGAPSALLAVGPAKTINPGVVGDGVFECPVVPFYLTSQLLFFGTIAANVGATNWAEAYDAPGNPVGANRYHWNGDTYSDGPTTTFGTDNIIDQDASYFLTYIRVVSFAPVTRPNFIYLRRNF